MKSLRHFLLPASAAALISVALSTYWFSRPDTFPTLLKSIGNWFIDALGIQSAEVSADAEALYVALVSLALAFIFVYVVAAIWWRVQRR